MPRRLAASVAACCFALSVLAPASATVIPGPLADFQAQLLAYTMRAPGHVGIAVEDVLTGTKTGVNSGAEMPAASTIKIPVMVEVFRQLTVGRFDLNRKLHLQDSDRDWGWGTLCDAPTGSAYTVSRLLALMIDESDNTATNMLIRFVGRQNINATMQRLGLDHTRLSDFIRSNGPIRWALRSSPADMARLLEAMAKDRLIDSWASREMIAILDGQHHNGLLPQPLPPGTTIAHKTGTLHDTLNDVGIVYLGEDPYVIAVMTTDLPTLDAGRQFIRGVSRMAYDALGRFATWRLANEGGSAAVQRTVPITTDAAPVAPDTQMWTQHDGETPEAVATALPSVAPVIPDDGPTAPPTTAPAPPLL
ncbi:MAG TPA: serine hydrolase [Candidatus Limnocylindria bacterium]|nr:serine hydrolase [Candidatus Limnocylindria bacterium]